jgi:hypothetical protein
VEIYNPLFLDQPFTIFMLSTLKISHHEITTDGEEIDAQHNMQCWITAPKQPCKEAFMICYQNFSFQTCPRYGKPRGEAGLRGRCICCITAAVCGLRRIWYGFRYYEVRYLSESK